MSISIQQSDDIRVALEAAFVDLNVLPDKRVFVKPNLCGREPVLPEES